MQRTSLNPPNTTVPSPGIFETIADGISWTVARPLLMIAPVLLDLYLWLGARLSPIPLTRPLAAWLRRQPNGDEREVIAVAEQVERVSDMAPILTSFVPSLLIRVDRDRVAEIWHRTDLTPSSAWWVPVIAVGLVLGGAALAMAYHVAVAAALRGDDAAASALGREVVVASLRYAAFLSLLAVVLGILAIPAAIMVFVFQLLGVNVTPLLIPPLLAAGLLLRFVPDSIAFNRVGPLRAVFLSVGVVRRNVWSSLGFVTVMLLTSSGLSLALGFLVNGPLGVALAVAAYSLVATGLTVAQTRFFADRLRRWRPDIPPVLPGTARPLGAR